MLPENEQTLGLKEESDIYYVGNKHDKMFRTLLDDKEDTAKFINKLLKTSYKKDDLEKYNSSFVNKIFKNQEADIVYKLKNEKIFFLIEHQTKIDYTMPYRIMQYELEIIESAIEQEKIKSKDYKFPKVIPIVLYTGRKKWNAKSTIEECQENFKNLGIKMSEYYIVDINDYTEYELLEDDMLISKMMLIEKNKNTEEIVKSLRKIIPKIDERHINVLERIVTMLLSEKLGKNETEKIIKKLGRGKKDMLAVLEMIREENAKIFRNGKKEGKLEGKLEDVRSMLKENIPVNLISKITKISKEEILKIKNEK